MLSRLIHYAIVVVILTIAERPIDIELQAGHHLGGDELAYLSAESCWRGHNRPLTRRRYSTRSANVALTGGRPMMVA